MGFFTSRLQERNHTFERTISIYFKSKVPMVEDGDQHTPASIKTPRLLFCFCWENLKRTIEPLSRLPTDQNKHNEATHEHHLPRVSVRACRRPVRVRDAFSLRAPVRGITEGVKEERDVEVLRCIFHNERNLCERCVVRGGRCNATSSTARRQPNRISMQHVGTTT